MMDYSKILNQQIAIVGMGYIGKHLHKLLSLKLANNNCIIDTYTRSNIQSIKGESYDYIFNCAGTTGNFRQAIIETIESNITLNSFILNNVTIRSGYTVMSSTRIYGFSGAPDIVFSENDINLKQDNHLNIDFIYDGSKKLMESLVWNICKQKNIKSVICRLSNVYGGFDKSELDDSTYLKLMIRHSIEKQPIVLNQHPDCSKDYIYIGDALKGIIGSTFNHNKSGVFNIASGTSISLSEWLQYLNIDYSISNTELNPIYVNISNDKATNSFGFRPEFSLHNLTINQIIK